MQDTEYEVTVRIKPQAMLIEFFGTAFICYVTGLAFVNQLNAQGFLTAAPFLAHGLITAFFYAVGKGFSGGLYNPAVSLAKALSKRISWMTFFVYVFFQLIGSLAGATVMWALTPVNYRPALQASYPHTNPDLKFIQLLAVETLISYLVILTYLFLESQPEEQSHISGAAIGAVIIAAGTASALYTQGGINPARSFGPSIILNNFAGENAWVFYLGPFIAAILAALTFKYVINAAWSFQISYKGSAEVQQVRQEIKPAVGDVKEDPMRVDVVHSPTHQIPAPLGPPLQD